jgi:hypothetical protein
VAQQTHGDYDGLKPYIVDLFCGLGGWAEGFLAERFDVIGFDIERHDYGTGDYPGQLVLQDVQTLHGKQFKDAAGIVASPPCTEYSYMAMPWKRAKQIGRALRGKDSFPPGYKGSRTVGELNVLFDACFRIQREASEMAGRHIPLIVENVRGAEKWVGSAQWHFGSFYLWGDIPVLMPFTNRTHHKIDSPHLWLCDPKRANGKYAPKYTNVKVSGQDWSRFGKTGEVSPHWRMEGVKQRDSGREWFAGDGKISRMTSSKSPARKAASAMIAKIPFPLTNYIARQWATKSAESETPSPALLD